MRMLLLTCLLCFQTCCAGVAGTVVTNKNACKLLIAKAEAEVWFPTIKKGHLNCDTTANTHENILIVSLRNGSPFGKEHNYPHSTLLGWFAVEKNGGAVMSYDVGENLSIPLEYGPSKPLKSRAK